MTLSLVLGAICLNHIKGFFSLANTLEGEKKPRISQNSARNFQKISSFHKKLHMINYDEIIKSACKIFMIFWLKIYKI